ncbi:MAG TPA: amylo-alpha-1,6-glucosidase [Methanothrix sp.]|nr:amylo-alpha-1,6-glucosidase [Methanothrix sp.]HOK57403.1 amylo-alpha-1,6-glucosidase [Methanothrix sp.]HOL42742.1 amylo-alpha-1,6-glucosidase [Methanothrix sp.]HPO87689.1 amylo-alpha-1,6-glucosidase [Methanothrix sp.]
MIPYSDGISREWIVTNGIGGYASSTSIGANTRAYHGLLIASLSPPVDRWLLLSSLDETVNGIELANHQYPGVVHPQGFRYLVSFTAEPLPTYLYRVNDVELTKQIFMIHGENTTVIKYHISGDSSIRIMPLVTSRSFHAVSGRPEIRQEAVERGVLLRSRCDLRIVSDRARYVRDEMWYHNFEYEAERARGLGWREDLLRPGWFEADVNGELDLSIAASMVMVDANESAIENEMERRRKVLSTLPEEIRSLAIAADSFLVRRGSGMSIIAGYHWFDDWGRDAMIALPGLLLCTGRFDDARAVLRTFSEHVRHGLVPNDLGAGSYNTVDASLLFIRAVCEYFRHTSDLTFIRELWPRLMSIIECYTTRTPVGYMDSDLLISSSEGATWMDARVDGRCVTPRAGKCVEVNALWYEALRSLEELSEATSMEWRWHGLADRVRRSFRRFWNPAGYLYDTIDPYDGSVRPNQVIAVAFSQGLLSLDRTRAVVRNATEELLTPYGLRTLSPGDPAYIGRYEGSPRERDRAYHQGTVWPWLIGPYITAYLKACRCSKRSRMHALSLLRPLLEERRYGIGTIAEVYDGDPPHRPNGCISQAWSVAEVIRAFLEARTGIEGRC